MIRKELAMFNERERWELSVYNGDLRQKRVIAARLTAGEITATVAEAQRELLRAVRTAILERGR